MAIIVHADGREDWIEEQFRVVTWTVSPLDGRIDNRRVAEVESFSDWTAIDVAVDQHGVCHPDEVRSPSREWRVINVADEQARRKARLLAEALREEAIEAEERQEIEDERRHNASLRQPS